MRMRNRFPNLFVPGAGKSGTSSLHLYLNQHPDIYMSDVKEPHYFSNDDSFRERTENYLSLFKKGENAKYIGESSTGYMAFPNVIERISGLCDSPKFIFLLRNPVDKVYSHYNWLVGLGVEDKTFEDAFLEDFHIEPKATENNFGLGYKYYYQWGRYSHWIERYVNNFGIDNILVITTENMTKSPLATLNSCFTFLDIEPLAEIAITRVNETVDLKYKRIFRAFLSFDSNLKNLLLTPCVKAIIPASAKSLYSKLYHDLRKKLLNAKNEVIIQPMTASKREWIADFYREDVRNLKKIMDLKLLEWTDFA